MEEEDVRGRIAYLERLEAELSAEEAGLPTVGHLRQTWQRVRDELGRVRECKQDALDYLAFVEELGAFERHLEAMVRRSRFHLV